MASSSRGFPTERLDARLGRFSREDNPTFTFQLSTFTTGRLGSQEKNNPPPTFTFSSDKNKAKKTEKAR